MGTMTERRATDAPDYMRAVAAAYYMRANYNIGTLAFDPFLPMSIAPDLFVCKYSTFCERHGITRRELLEIAESSDGFTLRRSSEFIIVYNDSPKISEARRRFTLAHELGHYTLRHRRKTETEEREADCFARNLLAPRLLAITYDIDFPDYPATFGISAAAARMCEEKRELDERYLSDLSYTFSDK